MEPLEELSSLMEGIGTPSPQQVTVEFHKVTTPTRIFDEVMLVEFQPGFVVFIGKNESFTALPANEIKEVIAVTLSEEEDED